MLIKYVKKSSMANTMATKRNRKVDSDKRCYPQKVT